MFICFFHGKKVYTHTERKIPVTYVHENYMFVYINIITFTIELIQKSHSKMQIYN